MDVVKDNMKLVGVNARLREQPTSEEEKDSPRVFQNPFLAPFPPLHTFIKQSVIYASWPSPESFGGRNCKKTKDIKAKWKK